MLQLDCGKLVVNEDKRLDDHIISDNIAFTRLNNSVDRLDEKFEIFKDQVNARLIYGIAALVAIFLTKLLDLVFTHLKL